MLPVKAVAKLLAIVPLSVALGFGRFLGFLYGNVLRYHRKDAFDALEQVFPEKSKCEHRRTVREMYDNLGVGAAESLRLAGGNISQLEDLVDVKNAEIVKKALSRNKGALILAAHFGNWDLLCFATPLQGFPLTIIAKDLRSDALNDFWMALRARCGLKVVPVNNSYRICLKTLKKNEVIGFMLDQNMIDTEGVFVEFFGRPVCTTPGLAYMAAQTGAPIIPAFIHRLEGGRHEIELLPVIEPPPDRKPETIQAATQAYTRVIEEEILKRPEQWIWIHRRWRTQPTAEDLAMLEKARAGAGESSAG